MNVENPPITSHGDVFHPLGSICDKMNSGSVPKYWLLPVSVVVALILFFLRKIFINSVFKANQTKLGDKVATKLSNSLLYFIQYTVLFTISTLALRETGFYKDKSILLYPYPNQVTPLGLICYTLELAVYMCSLLVLFNDPRKNYSDFKKLCFHHVFTVFAISISFLISFTSVGILIMNIHDVSDIFIEGGKSVKYKFGEKYTVPIFAIVIVVFTYTRGFYFVFDIIIYMMKNVFVIPEMSPHVLGISFCILCLWGLEILDIMWIINLFQIVLYYLRNKKIDDIRDPDDLEKTKQEQKSKGVTTKKD